MKVQPSRCALKDGRAGGIRSARWRMGWILLLGIGLHAADSPQGTPPRSAGALPAWESGVVDGWTFTLRGDGRLKARFTGARARPVSGVEFDVEDLEVETFRTDGELDVIAASPACRVRMTNDTFVISSPGSLSLRQADGRFSVFGTGFVWDHGEQRLVMTNQVETRIRFEWPIQAWRQPEPAAVSGTDP
jgi:hypothetical protein